MGTTQTKHQQVFDNILAANAQVNFDIKTADDACNVHGLILDIHVGNTGVGLTFGQWALVLRPRGQAINTPVITTSQINLEFEIPIFWMLGNWMTEAGQIDHIGGAPKSSRNCARNSILTVSVESSALSGSSVRVHGTATWFETTK